MCSIKHMEGMVLTGTEIRMSNYELTQTLEQHKYGLISTKELEQAVGDYNFMNDTNHAVLEVCVFTGLARLVFKG